MLYYKSEKIKSVLPNKLELDGKVIFNPKWHHYEAAGWKEFPPELLAIDRKYIKWVDGDPVEMTQEEKDVVDSNNLDNIKYQKIERLWQAATDYEYTFVANGGYSALLEAKLAGSSKAASFGDWIKTIWTEYYARRDQVTASHSQEIIDLINEDFSTVGPPPYLIREVLFGE